MPGDSVCFGGEGSASILLPDPPDPSASANTAPAVMQGGAGLPPEPDGDYVPTFRGMYPGDMSAFSAEGVAVDEQEKWCRVSLSVPAGERDMVAVDAVAILDTGSGVSTMSAGIARKLQEAYPGVQIVRGMQQGGKVKLADRRVRDVTSKTCPVRIALHTSWGLVSIDPFSFAVMPGDDDAVCRRMTPTVW